MPSTRCPLPAVAHCLLPTACCPLPVAPLHATGRLAHHLEEVEGLSLRAVEYCVCDEADRMFEMGFIAQVRRGQAGCGAVRCGARCRARFGAGSEAAGGVRCWAGLVVWMGCLGWQDGCVRLKGCRVGATAVWEGRGCG